MGYAFVIGGCVACGRRMTFNPLHVPSLRVGGVRVPPGPCVKFVRVTSAVRPGDAIFYPKHERARRRQGDPRPALNASALPGAQRFFA
jgi:hypothetical protein